MNSTFHCCSVIVLAVLAGSGCGLSCQPNVAASDPHLDVAASLNPIIVPAFGTAQLEATVTGGVPPYAFLWTQTQGPAATITTDTAQNTAVQFGGAGTYGFTVTVTDSIGTQATSLPVITTVQ
jgi:PKD repeat protein